MTHRAEPVRRSSRRAATRCDRDVPRIHRDPPTCERRVLAMRGLRILILPEEAWKEARRDAAEIHCGDRFRSAPPTISNLSLNRPFEILDLLGSRSTPRFEAHSLAVSNRVKSISWITRTLEESVARIARDSLRVHHSHDSEILFLQAAVS
jgi:hypothetical protein